MNTLAKLFISLLLICSIQMFAEAALSGLRVRRQLVTGQSVVSTPAGLVNIPPGSQIVPGNFPAPGIPTYQSAVATPEGNIVSIPAGSKVVPSLFYF